MAENYLGYPVKQQVFSKIWFYSSCLQFCLDERTVYSSSDGVIFTEFPLSNEPVGSHNVAIDILTCFKVVNEQNVDAILPADFWIFGRFGWCFPVAVHSAYLTLKYSNGSKFRLLFHTHGKSWFNLAETALNKIITVAFDSVWANSELISKTALSWPNF